MNFWTQGTSLRKVGTSLRNFGTSNPWAIEISIYLPMVQLSFKDPQVAIEGHSPPRNKLWHSCYIFYKIWYIIYKIWYIIHKIWCILKNIWHIQSLNYRNLYLITHDSFIPLGIFGKWLEVICYFEMNFGTLGTSLRKFDRSNPWANGTPISFSMVHFFIWRPSGSDWR